MKQAVEREMTKSEKAKEKRLKDKYDDSGMKDSMKDQYGDDWKNVYYATIRKKAMASFQNNNSMISEGEAGDHERMYKVVHVKKGMMDIKAKTSYEAAKKFAKEKGLKSTAGVDTHLYPLEEGHKVLPNIDKERYTEIPGLEGPFQTMSGKPIYYDPKEGAYYDRDTDMYLTYAEFKALDDDRTGMKEASMPVNATTKMHKLDVQEDAPISQMSRADLLDYLNMSEKDAEGMSTQELMDMAQDVTMDQMENKKAINVKLPGHMTKVTRFKSEGENKMGPQGITPGDRVEHEGEKFEVVDVSHDPDAPGTIIADNLETGLRNRLPVADVTRLFGMDAMTDQDKDNLDAMFKRLDKVGSGSLKHVATEGHSPHKKGTKKYKAHMAAMHANSAEPKGKMIEGVKRNILYREIGKRLAKGHSIDRIKKYYKDIDDKYPGHIEKIVQALKDRNEIPEARHANSVDLNAMRDALKLDESTDANTVVAEYTRACLDLSHNTWGKVCEQIDHVRSFVKEDVDVENVKIQLRKMHEREALDRNIVVKENIDKLRQIVKDKSAMSIKFADGTMKVDMTTANIFVQMYDRMKERNQQKIDDMMQTKAGFLKVLDFFYGAMK